MKSNQILIKKIFNELASNNLIQDIKQVDNFPDEPQYPLYRCSLKKTIPNALIKQTHSSGFSLASKELALLKCLGEVIERYSLRHQTGKAIITSSYNHLKINALDPMLYSEEDPTIRNEIFDWINGFDLTRDEPCLIPAQLAYLGYKGKNKEKLLTTAISTGAAGGTDYESTLLRGIYEVIERDAFMLTYLLKIKAQKIDLSLINNKVLKKNIKDCQKYNLELNIFDITNNLLIPSFLTIIIDKTGLGPIVSLGLKSGLNMDNAIIGSIEEAFSLRCGARKIMMKNKQNEYNIKFVRSTNDRQLLWLSPKMVKHLDFLLKQTPKLFKAINFNGGQKKELEKILKIFYKHKINVFCVDITPDNFRNIGYYVYKVIIPALQPLYLNEERKEFRMKRIKEISSYFRQKKLEINKIPHPFI